MVTFSWLLCHYFANYDSAPLVWLAAQGFDIRERRLSILGLGGRADSKADIVDDHKDLVGKLKAEF